MSLHNAVMAISLLVGGTEPAPGGADAATLNDMDKSFIDAIAAADRAEMELSRSVAERSAHPAVRRVAQAILAEDATNYHDLFKLCLARRYAIAPQLDERHRDVLRRVRTSATRNDSAHAYLDALLVDEARTSEMLERISSDATDGELARFAVQTAEMLRRHQQLVHELVVDSRG